MIENFRHRGLKRLYEKGDKSRLRPDIADKAELYLSVLDSAEKLEELDITGFNFHRLTGDMRGFYSVFVWIGGFLGRNRLETNDNFKEMKNVDGMSLDVSRDIIKLNPTHPIRLFFCSTHFADPRSTKNNQKSTTYIK